MTAKTTNRGGRPRTTLAEKEARGSTRASSERSAAKQDALAKRQEKVSRRDMPGPDAIIDPAEHARILVEEVGYDPYRDAGDCHFDPDAARDAVEFCHRHVVHVSGREWAGRSFLMEPWQQAIVMALWGWRRPNGAWRYREALIYTPRGNGKTFFSSALSMLAYFQDPEPGAEVFCAAAERGQARFLWDAAREMILLDPELLAQCNVGANAITLLDDPIASFRPVSSEGKTKHGGKPYFAVIDELHVQPNDVLYEAIRTGMGKRTQAMLVMLTTARWWDPEHICDRTYDYACKVRDGTHPDGSFLPIIYEARQDDD